MVLGQFADFSGGLGENERDGVFEGVVDIPMYTMLRQSAHLKVWIF